MAAIELEIYGFSDNTKMRSCDTFATPFDLIFALFSSVPPVVNLHANFEVPSFIHSRDMNSKSRSRNSFPTPFDLILNFLSLVPLAPWWSICMPNLKFLAQTVQDKWRGSQNIKIRSMTPS